MDVQLQELIDKIKKDGVETAESSGKAIVSGAEEKAQTIIREAESKAADIIKQAKAESDRLEKASIAAIQQAGRNLLISFGNAVTAQLSALVKTETEKAYNADMLKSLIPETVKEWVKKEDAASISVLLAPKDLKAVESAFIAALKTELAKGMELKADTSVSGGFRIGTKDGASYYDFSAESVAELFCAYLNPSVSDILRNAARSIT